MNNNTIPTNSQKNSLPSTWTNRLTVQIINDLAEKYGVKDNDLVDVEVETGKPTRFFNVQVRVHESFTPEMHIDTDDANACALTTGDIIKILAK